MSLRDSKVLVIGCGDIGVPLARELVEDGAVVWGLRRHPAALPAFIHPLAADVTDAESLSVLTDLEFDYVVTTLTPAGFSEQGYRSVFVEGVGKVLAALEKQSSLRRLVHVSSTSVYHQCDGEWVDEDSPTEPTGFSGRALLASEAAVAAAPWPGTVVRFAGIYGPGRRRLIEQVLAGEGCPREPVLYTNRIHRDDCVGVLRHILHRDSMGESGEPVYIGVDSEPVPMWDVKQWLAGQLQVELVREVAPQRRASKRCSNRRLLASGYPLRFADFRAGYRSVLDAG